MNGLPRKSRIEPRKNRKIKRKDNGLNMGVVVVVVVVVVILVLIIIIDMCIHMS